MTGIIKIKHGLTCANILFKLKVSNERSEERRVGKECM